MFASLFFFAFGGRADCPNKALTTKTDFTFCAGLTPLPEGSISSQEECEQACCDDPTCEAWQYCPDGETCFDLDHKNWQHQRCFNGPVPTSCKASKVTRFVGRTSAKPGSLIPVRTAPVTRKRGFSGFLDDRKGTTIFTCEDAKLIGLQDSWYYNWGSKSTQGDYCVGEKGLWGADISSEFAPLIINTRADPLEILTPERIADWERANVQFLLGYNEPDRNSVTYEMGAKHWVKMQQAAALFDPPLKLVTAAPSCTDWDDSGHSKWLDGFFDYCEHNVTDCDPELIDYIAFHDYNGNLTEIEQRINGMAKIYRKKDGTTRKIWLTEVGIGRWLPKTNGPTLAEKVAYIPPLLKMLDSHPDIFRYAWFTSRTTGTPNWSGPTNLFENMGTELTVLGELYKNTTSTVSRLAKHSVA